MNEVKKQAPDPYRMTRSGVIENSAGAPHG